MNNRGARAAYYAPKESAAAEKTQAKPEKKKNWPLRYIIAIAVAAILVCSSTAMSVEDGLLDICWEAESVYYGGAYNEDYDNYDAGLYDLLSDRYESANGILSVVTGYKELESETEAFRAAAEKLYSAYTPHAKCYTNNELQTAYENLTAAIENMELTEREETMLKAYSGDFNGSNALIPKAADAYNEAVMEVERKLSRFPANILKGMVYVNVPEAYE